MSIASELTKLQTNLTSSYAAIENKGGVLPSNLGYDNLASSINSINSTLNVGVVGSPTISGTTVSGFSTSNYLTTFLKFNLDSTYSPTQSWEQQFKFTTGSLLSGYQRITGTRTDMKGGVNIVLRDSCVGIWLTTNNTSWNIAAGNESSPILQLNTTYWVRVAKPVANQNKYTVSYSEDGSNFTQLFSVTASTSNPVASTQETTIGCGSKNYQNYPFSGSIDLSECYIKVGNVYLWRGCA